MIVYLWDEGGFLQKQNESTYEGINPGEQPLTPGEGGRGEGGGGGRGGGRGMKLASSYQMKTANSICRPAIGFRTDYFSVSLQAWC